MAVHISCVCVLDWKKKTAAVAEKRSPGVASLYRCAQQVGSVNEEHERSGNNRVPFVSPFLKFSFLVFFCATKHDRHHLDVTLDKKKGGEI